MDVCRNSFSTFILLRHSESAALLPHQHILCARLSSHHKRRQMEIKKNDIVIELSTQTIKKHNHSIKERPRIEQESECMELEQPTDEYSCTSFNLTATTAIKQHTHHMLCVDFIGCSLIGFRFSVRAFDEINIDLFHVFIAA